MCSCHPVSDVLDGRRLPRLRLRIQVSGVVVDSDAVLRHIDLDQPGTGGDPRDVFAGALHWDERVAGTVQHQRGREDLFECVIWS